ncbi:hypothetical protein AYI69_g8646, partial [Smittium culicis]
MPKNQSKKTIDQNTIEPTISEIFDASKGNEPLSNKNQAATIDYENQLEMFPTNPNKFPPISEVNQSPEICDRNSLFGSVNSNSYLHHLIPNIGPYNLFSGTDVEEFLEVYEIVTRGLKGERKIESMVLNINQKFLEDGKNLASKDVSLASKDVSLGKNPVTNTIERQIRCIYCDGFHQKRDCEILTEDLNKGLVNLDEKKSIILPNGIAIKPNYGNGGMKALLKPKIQSVNNNVVQVCANDSSHYVDERDYFSNEIQMKNDYLEIINEDEFEKIIESFGTKRKQEDIPLAELTSYKRINQDSKKGDNMSKFNIPENKNDEILDLPYTMKSKIVKYEYQDKVLQKCKQSLITLSLEEVASVSPLVRKSLNDDFRLKKEIKVDTINSTEEDISNKNWKKKYLSVGS